MKAVAILTIFLSLNAYANGTLAFKEADVSLSFQDLENEVFYNVEDVKLKDVKYIKSFDNKLIAPTKVQPQSATVRDLPFFKNVDTVILKPQLGGDMGGGGKTGFQLQYSMRAIGMMTGGEGGT